MAHYRIIFKALEVVVSTAFLVLCAKAFCSHFYNDLRQLLRDRRQKMTFVRNSPLLVPAVEVTARSSRRPFRPVRSASDRRRLPSSY
jgi:hypothetical protein